MKLFVNMVFAVEEAVRTHHAHHVRNMILIPANVRLSEMVLMVLVAMHNAPTVLLVIVRTEIDVIQLNVDLEPIVILEEAVV
ncbi:hypothetical protein JW968_06040 [Candidatus Woesearchaeota archaeon]|nr:hypothetical protein [Candidatus Woesearchaeota archaeon]